MRRIVPLATAAVALVVIGIAIAGIAVAGTAKSIYHYRSAMVPGSEVPKPKAPAGGEGALHRDRHRRGERPHAQLEADVRRPQRQGHCRPHPHG